MLLLLCYCVTVFLTFPLPTLGGSPSVPLSTLGLPPSVGRGNVKKTVTDRVLRARESARKG